jgi:hypothetical protein
MPQPGGVDETRRSRGEKPGLVSRFPKLTITMKPATKARLEAYSTLSGQPAWRIVDDAVRQLLETIPAEDKFAVEGMAKRIEMRHAAPRQRKTVA